MTPIFFFLKKKGVLPRLLSGKESACQFRRPKRRGFDPWVGKIPWRRKWQPTPVILLGKSYGQRSLVGYSPWDHKELDTTEWLSTQHTVLKMMIKITLCLSYFKRVMFSYSESLLLLLYVKGQIVDDREAWRATVQGLQRVWHSLATKQQPKQRAVQGCMRLKGPLPMPGSPASAREGWGRGCSGRREQLSPDGVLHVTSPAQDKQTTLQIFKGEECSRENPRYPITPQGYLSWELAWFLRTDDFTS